MAERWYGPSPPLDLAVLWIIEDEGDEGDEAAEAALAELAVCRALHGDFGWSVSAGPVTER